MSAGQGYGDSGLGVELDQARRRLYAAHVEHSEGVVDTVRHRLVAADAVDAVGALDRLSPGERFVLAVREIGARR